MNVNQLKLILDKYPNEQKIVAIKESRIGHDDARCEFEIKKGFLDPESGYVYASNDEDIRLH